MHAHQQCRKKLGYKHCKRVQGNLLMTKNLVTQKGIYLNIRLRNDLHEVENVPMG